MAQDDFAVVIGIAKYPSFGDTEQDPKDLEAPDDDASDVCDWLVDTNGGHVPEAQIHVVRTKLVPAGVNGTWPPREAIVKEFDWLEGLSQKNSQNNQGSRVGRRLYVYASGHGFARKRKEGAVFAANATRIRRHHVFASGWLEWFSDAAYFDETVLWMDTCMWPDSSTPLEVVGFRTLINPTGGARRFSAFAAQFPHQAVERPINNGPVRAIFTHTLLEGLRSGAADPVTRKVTSATLRNYLTNHMRDYLTEEDLNDDLISKEPDFGFDDPMEFCTLAAVPQTNVTLTGFPAVANGAAFSLLTGAPPAQAAQGVVQNSQASVSLLPGIYFLQMANPPIAKGFQVAGGSNVTIDVAA